MTLITPEELRRAQRAYLAAKVAYTYTSERVVRRAYEEANPSKCGNEAFVSKMMEIEEEYNLGRVSAAYQHAKRQLLLAVRGLFMQYYAHDENLQKVLEGITAIIEGNPIALEHEDDVLSMACRIKHPAELEKCEGWAE